MNEHLLMEGLTLMAYGMGFVFCFLTLLVGATTLMSKTINRYFPQAPPAAACPVRPAAVPAQDDTLIAVITAAIRQHRDRKR